jgi:hypothetical protein
LSPCFQNVAPTFLGPYWRSLAYKEFRGYGGKEYVVPQIEVPWLVGQVIRLYVIHNIKTFSVRTLLVFSKEL